MPNSSTCFRNSSPYIRSRSRSRYFGALSNGKASTICWAVHSAVGWAVTFEVNDTAAIMDKHNKNEQHFRLDDNQGETPS